MVFDNENGLNPDFFYCDSGWIVRLDNFDDEYGHEPGHFQKQNDNFSCSPLKLL